MDLHYSHEDQKFRRSVRTWIDSKLPHDLRQKVLLYDQLEREDYLRWHRILAKQGWVAPHWHEQWGATNWTVTQRYIFEEECAAAGCPVILPTGITMCALARPLQSFGFDQGTANLTLHYCNHGEASIYGGSNEIQRSIIAKQALGL